VDSGNYASKPAKGEEKAFFAERNWALKANIYRNGRGEGEEKAFFAKPDSSPRGGTFSPLGHPGGENGWPKRHDWLSRKPANIQLSNNRGPTLRTPCGEERLARKTPTDYRRS